MKNKINQKTTGYLFILSGLMFALAGFMDARVAFGGVSLMFIILGVVYIRKGNKQNSEE